MAAKKSEGGAGHPMIAALVAQLPAPGASWPAAKRAAWMQMTWLAFGLVYGEAEDAVEMPAFLQPNHKVGAYKADYSRLTEEQIAEPLPVAAPAPYGFYIDHDGTARSGSGDRVVPSQVGGDVIYDKRGEGDFATILWADETRGIRPGLQLSISPAF